MTLRAVLFDMDGTLVDTEILWWETVTQISSELGHRLSPEEAVHVTGASVEHTAEFLYAKTSSPVETIARQLDDTFCAMVSDGVRMRPGAIELLDLLAAHDVSIGLVSASPRRVVSRILRTVGADRFQLTVAAEDSPRNKPHPDPYLTALERLGLSPRSCVAVEDSPTGVTSAERAGCPVLAVPSSLPIEDAPGRLIRPSLEQVDLITLRALNAWS